MRTRRPTFVTYGFFASTVLWTGCNATTTTGSTSKATTTTTTASTSTTTQDGATTVLTALPLAYPGGLTLSVFPQGTSSGSLRLGDASAPLPDASAPLPDASAPLPDASAPLPDASAPTLPTVKEQATADAAILSGEGACLPEIFLQTAANVAETCYQFDAEMISSGSGAQKTGTTNGLNAAGEACLVSFARAQVVSVNRLVGQGLGLVQSMMCQGKKDGNTALPEVGKSVDFSTSMTNALGTILSGTPIATLARLEDQNGQPVYQTDISLTLAIPGAATQTAEMHLVHSPLSAESNETFAGKLWVSFSGATQQNGGNNPTNNFASIQYAKKKETDGTYRLVAELRRAMLATSLAPAAFVNGVLDLNAGANVSVATTNPNYGAYLDTNGQPVEANQMIAGIMYVSFNINPDDNTGTVAYWQNPGGSFQESARGMVFNLAKEDTTGLLKGCGYSGSSGTAGGPAMSIRKFVLQDTSLQTNFVPSGFYHPFDNTMPQNGCTITGPTQDDTGTYYTKTCGSSASSWFVPDFSNKPSMATAANQWVTSQTGTYVTRQCVAQNPVGLYELDTALITANAGFELVTPDTSITSPDLSDLVNLTVAAAQ